ncbi:MAG: hypothetical protein KAY50_01705 [Chitinophagaceae bacterium]|nr:hypothetical protein [Chitinophagaceae bacterium]
MKIINRKLFKFIFSFGLVVLLFPACQREHSDNISFATFPTTAYVFNDGPVGLGTNFYFPYAPDANNPVGSKANAWSVDNTTAYLGTSSMRIDVPSGNDVTGNYAGAILRVDGVNSGRNLTGYDALTFWAKGSTTGAITEIGFGEDFGANKFMATVNNLLLSTNWTKYIIPIPDPSKLIQERGMLRYAIGGIGVDRLGFTLWIDELKFEKLGTLGQIRPTIFNGADLVQSSFNGTTIPITGLTETFNLGNGGDQTVIPAPSYFSFVSSKPFVASVSELGIVTVNNAGTATITASINGVPAKGSLTITSAGTFPKAPQQVPLPLANNVRSIFSDLFTNVNVDTYNGNFGGSTTQTAVLTIGNDRVLYNTNVNYAGIQFQTPTVDATNQTFLHLNVFPNSTGSPSALTFSIRDRGANGMLETDPNTGNPIGDDKQINYTIPSNQLVVGQWLTIDIPLTGDILNQKNNLAQITFSGNINFYLDNIYFYKP